MEKITIGKITSAVGLKGEVKVYSYAASPDRFLSLERVFIEGKEYTVEHARTVKNMAVVKLSGIDDRDASERMRGKIVSMSDGELEELEDGAFYIRDLLGMRVINDDTDEEIGILKDILTDRPQDIYVVETKDNAQVLIPGVKEFIRNTSLEDGEIRVHLIEGML